MSLESSTPDVILKRCEIVLAMTVVHSWLALMSPTLADNHSKREQRNVTRAGGLLGTRDMTGG